VVRATAVRGAQDPKQWAHDNQLLAAC
jgi:hypothetical protein